jgi:hypothetical protein
VYIQTVSLEPLATPVVQPRRQSPRLAARQAGADPTLLSAVLFSPAAPAPPSHSPTAPLAAAAGGLPSPLAATALPQVGVSPGTVRARHLASAAASAATAAVAADDADDAMIHSPPHARRGVGGLAPRAKADPTTCVRPTLTAPAPTAAAAAAAAVVVVCGGGAVRTGQTVVSTGSAPVRLHGAPPAPADAAAVKSIHHNKKDQNSNHSIHNENSQSHSNCHSSYEEDDDAVWDQLLFHPSLDRLLSGEAGGAPAAAASGAGGAERATGARPADVDGSPERKRVPLAERPTQGHAALVASAPASASGPSHDFRKQRQAAKRRQWQRWYAREKAVADAAAAAAATPSASPAQP